MYLSKLEIVGFKSFADKITLSFQDGLCAIVGPNGVGKTNFVDAIRWVLGEQKTSVLRSENMENVIFNGSKNRKQLGMAEVSITIINNKKILPSEFDEINIARRLYRDGESHYLINKHSARLKDIQNLFMDSGLGADSYSVIELKMIENLLNGNVSDRREIFEEAAGIKKFKQNKKEASKKLQVVSLDIDRLNDILQEVQKNVNSLSRQAAKTKRYNTLINELRQLELNYLAFEFLNNQYKLTDISRNSDNLKEEITKLETEIADLEKFMSEIKFNFKKTDEKYQAFLRKEIEQNAKLSDANNAIKLNEEKINNIDNLLNSLKKEITDSESYIQKNTLNLEKLKLDYKNLVDNNSVLLQNLTIEKEKEIQLQAEFNQVQTRLNSTLNSKNELAIRKNHLTSIIQKNKSNTDKIQKRIEEENHKISSYEHQIHLLEQQISNHKANKSEINSRINALKSKLKNLYDSKKESEKTIENSRIAELELKKKLNEKQVEKKFLESIALTEESVKSLMSSKEWMPSRDKVLLGELISIDEKYKKAVLIAIEDVISAFIVQDMNDVKDAIKILETAKKGTANFIVEHPEHSIINDELVFNNSEVLGKLKDFIEIKEEYQEYLNLITQGIYLVHNSEEALELIKKNEVSKVVTVDGILFTKHGIIRGGSNSLSQKEAIIGRRNKITKLTKEIFELENEISKLQEIIKTEQANIWKYSIPDVENELKALEKQNSELDNNINIDINRTEIIKNSLQNSYNTIKQLNLEIDDFKYEITNHTIEIDTINTDLTTLDKDIEVIQGEFNKSKEILDEHLKSIRILEIDAAKNSESIKYINSEIEKVTALTENAKKRMKERQEEIAKSIQTKQILQSQIIDTIESRNQLEKLIDELLHEKQTTELSRKQLQEQIAQYDTTLDQYRKNYQKLQNEFYTLEIETAGIHSKQESLVEQSLEQYQVVLSEFINNNQFSYENLKEFDATISKNQINEIKEKIAGLGNVNFQALEDFEEMKQRLDFLLTQMNDLQNSKKTLSETIDEINKIAIEKFTKTFEEIRINFKHLFKLLFGEEGSADLVLEGENVLESGIYISAKPPFKKPSSIDLLSAGEKTLTAIALLFAIYLVKPSPFCILDEVDAPLDDNNIDKFVNLIKKFSAEKEIQFILITHNKRTMEAADTLYGLTMEEEGVTKIVSVKFDK